MRGPHPRGLVKPEEAYEAPALVILGTVAQLTQGKGQTGADRGTNSA